MINIANLERKRERERERERERVPEILAISVMDFSESVLKFGLTMSSIASADKLLKPDDKVLQKMLPYSFSINAFI